MTRKKGHHFPLVGIDKLAFFAPCFLGLNTSDCMKQVLNEDLRLVVGQQERMINGANVWNLPVSYDKLGVRYRLWRDAVERGAKQLPFSKST